MTGTTLIDGDTEYNFPHIERLTSANMIAGDLMLIAFVEGSPECWISNKDYSREAVAQIAAYYNVGTPGLCSWIECLKSNGWRNPTTPYSDQNPELYVVKR